MKTVKCPNCGYKTIYMYEEYEVCFIWDETEQDFIEIERECVGGRRYDCGNCRKSFKSDNEVFNPM